MPSLLIIAIIAWLGLGVQTVQAALYGKPELRTQILNQELEYRQDLHADARIEQLDGLQEGWISQRDKPFQGTNDPWHIWVKFSLPAKEQAYTVFLHAAGWEMADFYIVQNGKLIGKSVAGGMTPRQKRSINITGIPGYVGGFAEAWVLPDAKTMVFVNLATTHQFAKISKLRISLWDRDKLLGAERMDRIGQGMFLGIVGFLIFYNLWLFVVIREKGYLFYVLMEFGFSVAWSIIFGLTFEFIWPGRPLWDAYAAWGATLLGGIGLTQFLRHYLNTSVNFPSLDVFLKWGMWLNILLLPLPLLSVPLFDLVSLLIYSAPVGVILIIVVMARAWRMRHPQIGNLTLAMLCFAVGYLFSALALIGILPVGLFTHAGQLGSVAAGIVLSLGLSYKFQAAREENMHRLLEKERTRNVHDRELRELMEVQNRTLEERVIQRTNELQVAQKDSEALLANIFPQAIIKELRTTGSAQPRRHEEVSILFTDFSDFTQTVSTMPARRLVEELDEIFRAFDDIVSRHGLEKIKTIGDAYMAAAGLPNEVNDHAERCVSAALEMLQHITQRNQTAAMKWGLRVGVHSGAVVAGIVGKNKYAYDVWGDTVNLASRMESSGAVGRVNVSAYTFDLVKKKFFCTYRGKVIAKGKGEVDMYFVDGIAN